MDCPELKDDVKFGRDSENGMITISRIDSPTPFLCAINHIGELVIKRLDGKHRVEDISRALVSEIDIQRNRLKDTNIALFIAQLGMMNFLKEPFYINVIDTW
ncbi:hypothetical protein QUF72_14095 [Desulfobacterales bacterium HSG2]|nr:hypothetical protein [Desulfobacterales bacterium HSG2]